MNSFTNYYDKNLGTLRIATINDEPYFIGKDIANILGYKDHKAALRKNVPDSEKRIIYSSDIDIYGLACNNDGQTSLTDYSIPFSGLTGLTISGLATFLGKTKKSKTPALKKWLEDEILPELTDEPISLSNMEKVEEEDLEVIGAELANELSEFNNEEFGRIRGTLINDEPWFVGRDIAKALGYKNTKDAIITHVGEEDRRVFSRSENTTIENHLPKEVFPIEFVRIDVPNRGLTIINESGVYSLIFGSKLESAKRFKHWVTSEVLPSIRKHGAYATDATIDNIIADPDFGIRLLQELKDERIRTQEALAAKEAAEETIKKNQPLIDFATQVSNSKKTIDMKEMASLLCDNGIDIGRTRLFEFLKWKGIFLKTKPIPYQSYITKNYFKVKEVPTWNGGLTLKTYVTGTGQQLIYDLVVKDYERFLQSKKAV